MSSLIFKYSPMNAGKSSSLLQTAYNYEERGMHPLVMKPSIDLKGSNTIVSRAMKDTRKVDHLINQYKNIYDIVILELLRRNDNRKEINELISVILIDEAKFLTEEQVKQLSDITVYLDIPVICYGLRTDYRGKLFSGSEALFRYADKLEELTTICFCGEKALFNARLVNGSYVNNGEQIVIDGENADVKYVSLCPHHYKELVEGKNIDLERSKARKLLRD